MKYALVIATVAALATPALAEEVGVGVGVGPVGAGVTVGEGHRDVVRDHDRDRTTVIKEREPADPHSGVGCGAVRPDRRSN